MTLRTSLAIALAAAGCTGIALYYAYTPSSFSVEHIQALIKSSTSTPEAKDVITMLRTLKAELIRHPELKKNYRPEAFSWRRDVFNQINTLIAALLLQTPDQSVLAQILSLVDAIIDEFCRDVAGEYYNAEADYAAQVWRDEVYDCITAYATSINTMLPVKKKVFLPRSPRATDLQAKINLKNPASTPPPVPVKLEKISPLRPLQESAPETGTSYGTETNHPQSSFSRENQPQSYDDFYDIDDFVDQLDQQTYANQPAGTGYQTTTESASSPVSNTNAKKSTATSNTNSSANTSISNPHSGGSNTPTTAQETNNFGGGNDFNTMAQLDQLDKQKKALEELQKFMAEFKQYSKAEQEEANRQWIAAINS